MLYHKRPEKWDDRRAWHGKRVETQLGGGKSEDEDENEGKRGKKDTDQTAITAQFICEAAETESPLPLNSAPRLRRRSFGLSQPKPESCPYLGIPAEESGSEPLLEEPPGVSAPPVAEPLLRPK
jgi:hypothetical protein